MAIANLAHTSLLPPTAIRKTPYGQARIQSYPVAPVPASNRNGFSSVVRAKNSAFANDCGGSITVAACYWGKHDTAEEGMRLGVRRPAKSACSTFAYSYFPLEKKDAVFTFDGASPEVGAAHGERGVGGVDDDTLVLHLLDLAPSEAECPLSCVQYDVGRAFFAG